MEAFRRVDGPVFNGNFQGKAIAATEEDVDALARASQSEVGNFGKFGKPELIDALAAVVDTVFNRFLYHTTGFQDGSGGDRSAEAVSGGQSDQDLETAAPGHAANPEDRACSDSRQGEGAASKIKGTHFFNPDTSIPDRGGPISSETTCQFGKPVFNIHGFPTG